MSLCKPRRDGVLMICSGLVLNPRLIQNLNRSNIPCLRNIPDITLPNPWYWVLQDHSGSHNRKLLM
jgi:hypothetical protein